jgi:hypothetical protein
MGEAGDRVHDHGPPPSGAKVAGLAGELDDLPGVREAEVVDGDGFEGPQLDPAVGAVAGPVQDGDVVPGQAGAAVQERGLVGLDTEQVVGLLAGDQEGGGVGVGVQRVGGDHGAGQLQVGQQRLKTGDLTRGAVDVALGEDGAGGVVHRGEQVDLPAVVAFGAPQRLAVDRDRRSSMLLAASPRAVTVGQPCTDHRRQRRWIHAGKGPADSGLGGHRQVVGGVTASAERRPHRLGGIGGPLGDRGHRPGTG